MFLGKVFLVDSVVYIVFGNIGNDLDDEANADTSDTELFSIVGKIKQSKGGWVISNSNLKKYIERLLKDSEPSKHHYISMQTPRCLVSNKIIFKH